MPERNETSQLIEKVTVVTSKRRQDLSKSCQTRFTALFDKIYWVGRRAARGIPAHILRWDWGVLKMVPMARHLEPLESFFWYIPGLYQVYTFPIDIPGIYLVYLHNMISE
jgi:hypothetical protein